MRTTNNEERTTKNEQRRTNNEERTTLEHLARLGYVSISGVTDSDHRGGDAKALAIRAGSIAGGVIYAGLMVEVVRIALRHSASGTGSDAAAKAWTAKSMSLPYGRSLVLIAGLARHYDPKAPTARTRSSGPDTGGSARSGGVTLRA